MGRSFRKGDVLGLIWAKSSVVVTSLSALSTIQRIETKRHRVCLEVPEDVVSKNDEEEEHYGKRPRLNLIPPRPSQDVRRNKGSITCLVVL